MSILLLALLLPGDPPLITTTDGKQYQKASDGNYYPVEAYRWPLIYRVFPSRPIPSFPPVLPNTKPVPLYACPNGRCPIR